MRVIGGRFRSRVLVAPQGNATRPTSDRLRETLFNILGESVVATRWADLYAGSGAVGIEALSRGATACLFAEHATSAAASIRKNLASLQLTSAAMVDVHPVARVLKDLLRKGQVLDCVFLDPPYESADEYLATLGFLGGQGSALLASEVLVIAEHARRWPLPERIGKLRRQRLLEQGDAALSFYVLDQ